METKKIKVYDIILDIEINKGSNVNYKEKVENLFKEYQLSFLEEEKKRIFNEILDYKDEIRKVEKATLTFYSEAYDHENTLNGKLKNFIVAENLSNLLKEGLNEKAVITPNEINLTIDGIGTFKGKNISNIDEGVYSVKVSDVKIEEKESNLTGIAIIGDTRREIVESLLRIIKNENKLFSDEIYKSLLIRPENPVNGSFYKGVNRLKLGFAAAKKGYKDPRWVTFKQANSNGWKIKKGEKGTVCEKWVFTQKVMEKDKNGKIIEYEKKLPKPYSNYFLLFNAEQINGIPKLEEKIKEPLDQIINNLKISSICNIETTYSIENFNYDEKRDSIKIPQNTLFSTKEDYIETLLHEMCHATGSENRLKRHKTYENFLQEELITEIATVFLKSDLGLEFIGKHIEDHSSLPKYYALLLEEDYHGFFRMCAEAEKAADMLYNNYQLSKEKEKTVRNEKKLNLTEQTAKRTRSRSRARGNER